ncbi:HORMA domain-containing protein 1 isoform X2 [Nelusetta ayraudi]|uniref:HORMA domain-containing protein 1 isoform X2 n=1 Tax=Nelusetta ayraudi TaxID=303726 RepID=UPI003F7251DF
MTCVQQVRASQETQLLPSQVLTEQQSAVVIKKLLAIAVSSITYLRGLFPDKAYGSKYVDDQKVMILREEGGCAGAVQIVQWLQGCFDAIQNKYLRTVVISIYTDQSPQKLTELYQFRIQYTIQGEQMDFECINNKMSMACDNTRKASILLVRKLYTLMQNLGPLPDNVCLNMKLAYYDEVTPQDYQPPGFKETDSDTIVFEKEPVKLTLGEVVTPYHSLKLHMATERQRLEQVEESVCEKEKYAVSVQEEGVRPKIPDDRTIDDGEKPEQQGADVDAGDVPEICEEKTDKCEIAKEIDSQAKKTSYMVFGSSRTRSGRIISSSSESRPARLKRPMAQREKGRRVSRYDIPNSQEAMLASAPAQKKRKFSEPKEHF